MNITSISVGELATNCYIVNNLIIDPGDDAAKIIKYLEEIDVTPTKCILTHAHYDHILAAKKIVNYFNIPLLLNKKDLFLLEENFDKNDFENKLNFNFDDLGDIEIIKTPGHTPGGISIYFRSENVIFVGDLIFNGGYVGRTDFEYSCSSDLENSINKVVSLPRPLTIYPGHGSSFTLHPHK